MNNSRLDDDNSRIHSAGILFLSSDILLLVSVPLPLFAMEAGSEGKDRDNREKYVLITGFGKETAIRLDQMGFRVFATCLTTEGEQSLKAVCSDRLKILNLDVTKTEMIQDVYKQVKEGIPQGIGLIILKHLSNIAIASAVIGHHHCVISAVGSLKYGLRER